MNKQEIKQEIENLYRRLSELEEELAKPDIPKPKWVPELDEGYWCIVDWKEDGPFHATNDGMEIDSSRFSIGNIFHTKEEAEFAIERLKVLEEVRQWADGSDFGPNTPKFIIHYSFMSNKVTTDCWFFYLQIQSIVLIPKNAPKPVLMLSDKND